MAELAAAPELAAALMGEPSLACRSLSRGRSAPGFNPETREVRRDGREEDGLRPLLKRAADAADDHASQRALRTPSARADKHLMLAQDPMTLQAALRKLEAWRLNASEARQRRFARFPVRCEARIWLGEGSGNAVEPTLVHVRDLSRGGAGILSSAPMNLGQFCQVQFIADRVVITSQPAFCRHSREVTAHAHLIGLEFAAEASLLMAMGVPAKDLAENDEPEQHGRVSGRFVGPGSLDTGAAAD